MIKKEVENFTIYDDLTTEIEIICNIKSKLVPKLIGTTGNMSKSLRQYTSNVYLESRKRRHSRKQPISNCTHTHTLLEIQIKNTKYLTSEITLYVAYIVNREELQLYIP
jgi:hypothetical protein